MFHTTHNHRFFLKKQTETIFDIFNGKKFKSLFGRFSLTAFLEYCISQGRDLDSYIIVLQPSHWETFCCKEIKKKNTRKKISVPLHPIEIKQTTKPIKNLINWREFLEVISSFSYVYISVLKPWKRNILLWPIWNTLLDWYPRIKDKKKVLQFYQWSSTIVLLKTGNDNLIRSSTDTKPCQSCFKI